MQSSITYFLHPAILWPTKLSMQFSTSIDAARVGILPLGERRGTDDRHPSRCRAASPQERRQDHSCRRRRPGPGAGAEPRWRWSAPGATRSGAMCTACCGCGGASASARSSSPIATGWRWRQLGAGPLGARPVGQGPARRDLGRPGRRGGCCHARRRPELPRRRPQASRLSARTPEALHWLADRIKFIYTLVERDAGCQPRPLDRFPP